MNDSCSSTYQLVQCMQAPTQEACGSDEPVYLMYKIVAVSFENFHQLYDKLGIDQALPPSCQAMIDLKNVDKDQYSGKKRLNAQDLSTPSSVQSNNYPRQPHEVFPQGPRARVCPSPFYINKHTFTHLA
jgi:hypothetical protein